MRFVCQNLPAVTVPCVYAYEGPESQFAADAGAVYMLLEGFYGNTLQDIAFDICSLPTATQEHIMTQWTTVQAELATLSYPQIGSISSISETGDIIDRLSSAVAEGLVDQGPFPSAVEYFSAMGEVAFNKALDKPDPPSTEDPKGDSISFAALSAFIFIDIVQSTRLFEGDAGARYPFNHMDLGTQIILVDDDFNFLAIIDWEFAQTAPWQVNHFPMQFPLLWPDEKIAGVLQDPEHIAHRNVSRQASARRLYAQKFRDAEAKLRKEGRPLEGGSFAEVLESAASRIYACFTWLPLSPEEVACFYVRQMVGLAFGFDAGETEKHIDEMRDKLRRRLQSGNTSC